MLRTAKLAVLIALSGIIANAGVILTGSETWTTFPSSISTPLGSGTPYWDNASQDGTGMNVGYFLTSSGGFSGTNYNPTAYLSQTGGFNSSDSPASIALMEAMNPLTVTLIGSNTANLLESFGYYDASQTTTVGAAATEQVLYGPGSFASSVGNSQNLNFSLPATVGFYLTQCVTYNGPQTCSQYETWFSNTALDTTGQQHFVIFETDTNPNVWYLGVEDTPGTTGIEKLGDFNDLIVQLQSPATPTVPEPATFGLLGIGLAGLVYGRRRMSR